MRYKQITAAAGSIAVLLVGVALLTAAVRSSGRGESHGAASGAAAGRERRDSSAPPAVEPASAAERRALGGRVFASECAACHGAPAGLLSAAAAHAAGPGTRARDALVDLLLSGTSGGQPDSHPSYAALSDAELAAVLDLVLAASAAGEPASDASPPPLVPEDVARRRVAPR